MPLQKLETVDAFVVRDLDWKTPAIGIVRSGPKILQGGAKDLARSQTYQCAALGLKVQGASAGVNATPDDLAASLASFAAELLPAAESGALRLEVAKGVEAGDLQLLADADGRGDIRRRDIGGISNKCHLAALGAVVCAEVVRPLEGLSVAIENFDETGVAIARLVKDRGGSVVAVSTSAGAAIKADGFDVDELIGRFATEGATTVASLTEEVLPFWRILGAKCDVLFAGSKAGLIDHKGAVNVKAQTLVPTGPIPYTTKAAIMLERQGTVVLPDFITSAGAIFASLMTELEDQSELEAAVTSRLGELTTTAIGRDAGPILEACHIAEAFLKSWCDEMPFGRPFAP